MRLRAFLGLLSLFAAGCTWAAPLDQQDGRGPARLAYFLAQVCLPHLHDHIPIAALAQSQHLHRVTQCSIQECLHRYCSDDPSLGCVDLQETTCALTVTNNPDFKSLEDAVSGALSGSSAPWREVRPNRTSIGYGRAFCSADNSTSVTTFGVAPGLAPALISPMRHAEFDVHVSALTEPGWCLSPDRTGLF